MGKFALKIHLFSAALLTAGAFTALAADPVTTPEDQTGLTLAVYQHNIALVREQRRIELPDGRSRLEVVGVPSAPIPKTDRKSVV